jgi:ATP phosphoribosyltransferase
MLKVALPSGSLEKQTLALFADSLMEVVRKPRSQKALVNDPRISSIVIMNSKLIPTLVEQGAYDVGICGWDLVLEKDVRVKNVAELEYSQFTGQRAKVVLFNSVDDPVQAASEIEPGSKVLSEYPNLTKIFFDRLGIEVDIESSDKTTEANIPEDYRYGVCVSERGETLNANNQKVIDVIIESATTLIANEQAIRNPEIADAVHILELLLVGTLEGRKKIPLTMNVPAEKIDAIIARLPAMKRPTVSELWGGGWFSVTAVVNIAEVNIIIPELLKLGAEDIIQGSLSRVIPHW